MQTLGEDFGQSLGEKVLGKLYKVLATFMLKANPWPPGMNHYDSVGFM